MKKTASLLITVVLIITLTGCSNNSDVLVDYGKSEMYSAEEMESAVNVILNESRKYDLKKINYVSDEENNEQYEICVKKGYDQYSECICFNVEFYIEGEGLLHNYWTLARKKSGHWKSVFKPF